MLLCSLEFILSDFPSVPWCTAGQHHSALDEHDHVCSPTLEHHLTSTKTVNSKTFSVDNKYIGSTNLFSIEV